MSDHHDALAALERLDKRNRALEAANAKQAEAVPAAKPEIRLLDHHPAAEQQARREGEAVLGLMHAAGVGTGKEWISGASLAGGDR